ncbi:MAG: nucleotidyltransferase family protein [Bacteroidota bacterium]
MKKYEAELKSLILADEWMMKRLLAVQEFGIEDAWIGAGFVRNRVWDHLHDFPLDNQLNDIDVIYFNPNELSPEKDQEMEAVLSSKYPNDPWSVKNQARMHLKHMHNSYQSCEEALSNWVETPTCVAAKLWPGISEIHILAPYGLEDLMTLKVRPNPSYGPAKAELYNRRIRQKKWANKWPKLDIRYM